MLGEEATTWLCEIMTGLVAFFAFLLFVLWATRTSEPPRDPADSSLERVDAMALAAQSEAVVSSAPPLPVQLPYFPYAASSSSETTAECVICLEPLLPGQLCCEVPACCHAFHRDCLGEWAKSKVSCPLCRAEIIPGSDEVAVADDMV